MRSKDERLAVLLQPFDPKLLIFLEMPNFQAINKIWTTYKFNYFCRFY